MPGCGQLPRFWPSAAVRARTVAGRAVITVLRRTRLHLQRWLAQVITGSQRLRHHAELSRHPYAVIDRGHPVPAGHVERLRFDDHRRRLLSDLIGAVERAGGRTRPVTTHWHQPIALSVDRLDHDRLWQAVGALTADHPGLVVQRYDPPRDTGLRARPTPTEYVLGPAIRTTLLPDPALSRPWTPGGPRPAELTGPAWQITGHAIDDSDRHLGGAAAIRLIIDPQPRAAPALITEPIDIVYTWVDADDPDWQRAFAAIRPGLRPARAAMAPARFSQYDELRYSLRSIAEFAPWARRIWIVTNGQVPHWLSVAAGGQVTADGRVGIVPHAELWRGEPGLPTFNSQAIEACLHRIDGLAEKFVYFNDDVFLGRPVSPEMFFRPGTGRPIAFPSNQTVPPGPPAPYDLAPDAAGKNNRGLIAAATGRMIDHKYLHAPHALSRSILQELEELFPTAFAETRRATVRSLSDLATCGLHHGYALATGRADRGRITHRYVDVASRSCARDLADIARYRCYDTFCLNATREEGDERMITDFLRRYFPVPSSWEIADDRVAVEERTA